MTPLTLIGAGGHGKVVADLAAALGYDRISFLDDAYPARRTNGPWPIIGAPQDTAPIGPLFCAIGRNGVRANMFETFDLWHAPSLRHPAAICSPFASIGAGSVLMAGTIINTDSTIGRGCIINTAASVDHDCQIGDFVHISPGARLAGGTRVGPRSWVGIGAGVREGTQIGADVIIGAGAAVVADVPDGTRVRGVPAKPF